MMPRPAILIIVSGIILAAATGLAVDFDKRAKEMGLAGLEWDGTFTVYASDDALAKEALAHVRSTYRKILDQLNQRRLRKKCLVFVWDSRYEYVRQAGGFHGGNIAQTGAFVRKNFWGGCHALFTFKDDDLYARVLPHELAHLVLPLFLDPTKEIAVPLWLNEGFAQCQEEGSLPEAAATVSGAMERKGLFTLDKLTKCKAYPPDTTLFYDQSELLISFLIEQQKEKGSFFNFAYAISSTDKGYSWALRSNYPQWDSVEAFKKGFTDYVSRLAETVPAESYQVAYRSFQSARQLEHRGDREGALREYARALEQFTKLSEDFKKFKPAAVKKCRNECGDGMTRVSGMEESIGLSIGDSRAKVISALGKPESEAKTVLVYPGMEVGLSGRGVVSSISMEAPCDKMLRGIRVGDSIGRLEAFYGLRSHEGKSALAQALLKETGLLSLDQLETGAYPVVSRDKFLGQVVKLEGDNELHYIAAISGGRVYEEVTFEKGKITQIELQDIEEALQLDEEEQDVEKSGWTGARELAFDLGDRESKFTALLGAPLERQAKPLELRKTRRSLGNGGIKTRTKEKLTDRFQMCNLEYPGLSVITSHGEALCIVAAEPFKGKVHGIGISDSKEKITKTLGRADREGKGEWSYNCGGDKLRYVINFDNGAVSKIKAYRRKMGRFRMNF